MGLLDQMQPTPRNRMMGLLADALTAANDYAQKPDKTMPGGLANPPLSMLSGMLGLPSIATTAQRASYGEPLTNIGKANVPLMKPETMDTLLTLAPMAMAAAPYLANGAQAGMANLQAANTTGRIPMAGQRGATVWHGSPIAQSSEGLLSAKPPGMKPKDLKLEMLAKYKELLANDPYSHYGVRVIAKDTAADLGSSLPRSSKWVDGKPLSTKLPGTAVFQLTPRDAEKAIDHAMGYNLGADGQRLAIVQGDELGKNMMPEAFSALIKSPRVVHVFDRPEELRGVFDAAGVRKILEGQ